MKAQIVYLASFAIPFTSDLPHGEVDEAHDICSDRVVKEGNRLILSSRCGSTTFRQFHEYGGQYVIPAGAVAEFEGAWRSLNAIWGIEFPNCEVTQIKSTKGCFATLEAYEAHRAQAQKAAA